MKSLLRLIPAAFCAIFLPACVGIPGEYGYNDYGYDDGPGYSSYRSSPAYYGTAGAYYGSGYGRPYYGGSRYYRGYDYDDDHRHSSSSNRKSSSNKDKEEAIRLVKVRDGTRGNVPEGYHSKEYFKNRGISLSKNVYETRDGDRRGYSGSSSSSSNKKSSSSSSNRSSSERSSGHPVRGRDAYEHSKKKK